MEKDRKIVITHDGRGIMEIDKTTGDRLHVFQDGGAHIDKKDGSKLIIEKLTGDDKVKDLGGFF